jgi:hypothetical protein
MLHRLRANALLTRLVLVWFVLFVGSAVAAPLLNPTNLQMVCSGAGMKLIDGDGAAIDAQSTFGMDCPGCMPTTLPALHSHARVEPPQALAHALLRTTVAHLAALAAPPLPSRGPPIQNQRA